MARQTSIFLVALLALCACQSAAPNIAPVPIQTQSAQTQHAQTQHAQTQQAQTQNTNCIPLMVFYPAWRAQEVPPNSLPFADIDALTIAFAMPQPNGHIDMAPVAAMIGPTIAAARAHGVKVYLSIGGGDAMAIVSCKPLGPMKKPIFSWPIYWPSPSNMGWTVLILIGNIGPIKKNLPALAAIQPKAPY